MKFSIVTPAYNMETWIRETIESVLSQQGDFEIEYILQDGGSKDKTVSIFKEYQARLESGSWPVKCKGIVMHAYSEKDKGTSDAINRGFARATGDIYTWCDADNTYVAGAFEGLAKIFAAYPEVQWLKGYSSTRDEDGTLLYTKQGAIYRQDWLRDGIYGMEAYFVAADTVFWTADLWKKTGPIPDHFRCSGDCWLWIQMAKYTPLWSANLHVTEYRKRAGGLSKNISNCKREQREIRPHRTLRAWSARAFFSPQSRLYPRGEKFFLWLYPILFMHGKTQEYFDFEDGNVIKKPAKTFIIGDQPSYGDIRKKI
jgi:glycosyltransferase involved in cell wall biosynthesis